MLQFNILDYPIIRLTPFLVIGIVLSNRVNVDFHLILVVIALLIIVLVALNHRLSKGIRIYLGPDLVLYTIMIGIGIALGPLHDHRNLDNHYSTITTGLNTPYNFIIRIQKTLKPSQFQEKYIAKLLSIDGEPCEGRLLVNIDKDSLKTALDIDQIIAVNTTLQEISKPLNPYQFDYRRYMARQNIYHQIRLRQNGIKTIGQSKTILGFAAWVRQSIRRSLEPYSIASPEWAVMNAMLLGQRQEISPDLYDRYAQSGAIHILAISGLHIGIILLLLQFGLKPLEILPYGKGIKLVLIVILLWGYALIAGLSASVLRACCMFSLIAIALNMKRQTHVLNTIFISVFILLLINPNNLYDVGFQLSYSAVLAIVTIEPIIQRFWQPKHKPLKYMWRTFTVTLTAQIGVLPLSLYYFHQFPGLFLLSNMVIIPTLSFILAFGFLVLGLAVIDCLPFKLMNFFEGIIRSLNRFITFVSDQEQFVLKDITLNSEMVIIIYFILVMFVWIWHRRDTKLVLTSLFVILIFQGIQISQPLISSKQKLVIFHRNRLSMIGFQSNRHLKIYHSLKDKSISQDKVLNDFKIGGGIKTIEYDSIPDFLEAGKIKILVIDSFSVFNVKTFRPDMVILRNSPRVNLKRLIDSLHPKIIVWDGSNYNSYQKRWAWSCKEKNIPFHQTGEKGAYIKLY